MLGVLTVTSYPINALPYNFTTGSKLVNTDCIFDMEPSGANDALITYRMRPRFSRSGTFQFIVSETTTQVVAVSNTSANSVMIAIPIFEEDVLTSTAVAHYFNVDDIVWAENDSTGQRSYLYVHEGTDIKTYRANYNIAQIYDIAATGTTTTTTGA